MTTNRRAPWAPDWVVQPGELLVETLADRSMTQAELARRIARPLKTISEIANGRAAITPDTAIQLERALGISAAFWNGLEIRYREGLARERANAELGDFVVWARRFPIKELARHGQLDATGSPPDLASQLLAYFGVSSPAGWEQHWGRVAASYRLARSATVSPYALTAWLRWGEREADEIDVGDFDEDQFRKALEDARSLSRLHVFDIAKAQLVELFARAGVALVLLPSLPGAPASGASRWYRGGRPLIQLTLRFLSDDQFWYSVYHEAGHLIAGRRRRDILEEIDGRSEGEDEQLVDAFARDQLIPPAPLAAFVDRGLFDRASVRAFASELRVSPGIVVGRLQHDRHVGRGQLNDLKRSLEAVR
jgi:addiction module antidote protein, HigA family